MKTIFFPKNKLIGFLLVNQKKKKYVWYIYSHTQVKDKLLWHDKFERCKLFFSKSVTQSLVIFFIIGMLVFSASWQICP